MGQKIASLEIELGMATGTAVSEIQRFGGTVDAVSAQAIRDLDRIDVAMKGVSGLDAATASAVRLADETARSALQVARDAERSERAGERMVAQLERQIATYGLTRSEVRALRAEEAALAAERNGQGELASRIRAREADLYASEFAAARKAQQAADAAAEDAAMAAEKAIKAKEREAQAVREAAFAYQQFERAAREGLAAWKAEEAARARAAAEAAVNAQLLERSRIEAALARTMGTDRPRATDAGATFSALAAQAAEQEARALREAAFAHGQFEARAREGMVVLRAHEAATEADAAALARLRAMIDPAAAAQDRLNAELADARRLLTAAGASADEMARAEDALWDRSRRATQQHDEMTGAARRSGFALQTVALQLPDITQGLLTGQKPMTVFIQQGFQIVQVAQMAEGGLKGFGRELGLLAIRFAPFLGVLAAAGAGIALFNRWVNQGVTSNQLTRDLGDITGGADATKQELFKLKDATVSFGSTAEALFRVLGKDIATSFVGDMASMSSDVKSLLDDLTSYGRKALAGLYAGVAGMKSYLGEIEKGGVVGLGKMLIGQGDPDLLKKTFGASYDIADKYLGSLGERVRKEAINIERQKLAEKIGFNNTPKPKVDRHAEQLARDAAAIEAQIENLYALADAYGASGEEALIAEARVKAESKAIRQRGDIEAAVAREVRLAVAQRVSDAAKTTAGMRDQAAMQERINKEVADGNIVAEQAGEIMRDRMADLPLLAALEAARRNGDLTGTKAAERALDEQRAARERLTDAERKAQTLASLSQGEDRLAMIREEIRLIGADEEARTRALAVFKAEQEARAIGRGGPDGARWVQQQGDIAVATFRQAAATREWNDALTYTADQWDLIARNVSNAARGMADAFGEVGRAIGDAAAIYATYRAEQEREVSIHKINSDAAQGAAAKEQENRRHALATATTQIAMYGDMAHAARGFFKEGSDGYKALTTATQVFRAIEFALSVRSMAQDAVETASSIAKSAARAVAHGVEAVAKAIASLPFPANLAAGAATAAALAAIGVSIVGGLGGGNQNLPEANKGTGTVLGDPDAQSESIRRGLDALREVDLLMLNSSRDMANSLRSIESQIGGVASLVTRSGTVNANDKIAEGFTPNLIGSILGKIPLIGGFLGGLFGSKTSITGGGLYAGPQSLGDILAGGFDASTYTDVKKEKKFFGIKTGTSYSTQYGQADAGLENQFALILRDFNDAIVSAAAPLGSTTRDIEARLSGFVVNLGKIDLNGLSGEEIEERLTAVFGAAADRMAATAFPGMERFQRVGEGLFETLVRVASTVEAVDASFATLGRGGIGIDASIALVGLFDSVSDFASAQRDYFDGYYTAAEQASARREQMERALAGLGLKMPATLAGFRALVDAQDLASAAGRQTYATLIQLAPAFADLQQALGGAKSAADIAAERQDLERKLLELAGDTDAIRALDLAKLDASNRGLQQQVWAVEAAQEAAKKADELRKAWGSVGDGIMEEVRRIRGLDTQGGPVGFAGLMGQFNATTASARIGDMDAAKQLPALSRSLLDAAAKSATSRQELDRVQAETAASLEATYAAIAGFSGSTEAGVSTKAAEAMAQAATAATAAASSNGALIDVVRQLREEMASMRAENSAGHAATAANTRRSADTLDRVTEASGGDAVSIGFAA